jgi:hypothetical protein
MLKDKHLKVIERQIIAKQNMLLKQKHHIDEQHKTNEHLSSVKNKYDNYYKMVGNENKKMLEYFQNLDDYLIDKKESISIKKEIKHIQENINKLI